MKAVSFSLSDTDIQAIEDLVRFKGYKNRSHVIRKALDLLYSQEKLKREARSQIDFERAKPRRRPHG